MTSTEVAVFDTAVLVPAKVFAPGGIEAILSKLEDEARSEAAKLDISTAKGRADIKSLAYKVARSKTALDKMGLQLTAETRAFIEAINADRKVVETRLDALRDEVRKPVDDLEAAEKERIKAHETALAAIPEAPSYGTNETAADLSSRLEFLRSYPARDWQEFKARAEATIAAEITRTEGLLAAAQKREEERAELERLRQEAAERTAREEAARIEREKQEAADRAAAQAKAAAEAEAQRKAEEEAARVAEEQRRREAEAQAERDRIEQERLRAERERAEAEERAMKAEADRVAAEQRAKEAAEQAERDRVAAAEKAERDRVAAEQEAARRERQRIEDERRAEEAAAAKREADKAHKALINREAMADLVAAGLSEAAAKTAVVAIAKGGVAHTRISY